MLLICLLDKNYIETKPMTLTVSQTKENSINILNYDLGYRHNVFHTSQFSARMSVHMQISQQCLASSFHLQRKFQGIASYSDVWRCGK